MSSLREEAKDFIGPGWTVRLLVAGVVLYLLLAVLVGMYWSRTPDLFEVTADARDTVGVATTRTLIQVSRTLLDKPGGFVSNDILPPGVWLDNVPNWEYGVLIQVRDLTRALRESFSRSQSQSREDVDLARAEPRLNFSNRSWAVPASESEYRDGIKHLRRYLKRLSDPEDNQAQFYARADNLRYWLAIVDSRLGSLSQRLSASVGAPRFNTDLAGDASARQSTAAAGQIDVRTPWLEIDDVFFEARGTTWALIHFLRAVEIDFADVLANKNAAVSLRQIIRELEATQQPLYSPIVLNGSGFGVLANHSLVMASYVSRANAAIADLRDLLSQG
ncbi:MAG TPA: DUF2333 family protein [Spongiibacteraceae bacterium]|nr:DUF2333 family protein [Spongiibacteraceae bacterium]